MKVLDEQTDKGVSVEGERISGVVRRSRFKAADEEGDQATSTDGNSEERNADDDYVLSKLFRNSNVHSVKGIRLLFIFELEMLIDTIVTNQ